MPLSDIIIRNAKHNPDKLLKLADEKGMYLVFHQNGSKYFRLDYRLNGKRKTLALGVYPETSLKDARFKRDEAREQIAKGVDPGESRKTKKIIQARAFERITQEWLDSITHSQNQYSPKENQTF